jgi:hypothetical protein
LLFRTKEVNALAKTIKKDTECAEAKKKGIREYIFSKFPEINKSHFNRRGWKKK